MELFMQRSCSCCSSAQQGPAEYFIKWSSHEFNTYNHISHKTNSQYKCLKPDLAIILKARAMTDVCLDCLGNIYINTFSFFGPVHSLCNISRQEKPQVSPSGGFTKNELCLLMVFYLQMLFVLFQNLNSLKELCKSDYGPNIATKKKIC